MVGKKIIFKKPEQKDIEQRIDAWVETGKITPEKKKLMKNNIDYL